MNWELLISIISLVMGGGCIVWIFQAGHWKGEVNTRIEYLMKELASAQERFAGKIESSMDHATGAFNAKSNEVVAESAKQLRDELSAAVTRIHQRLDEKGLGCQNHISQMRNAEAKIEAIMGGIATQRQEWATLMADVRSLLRSEATTTSEIANFKERLAAFEHKLTAFSEKAVRLESDISHLSSSERSKR